MNMLKLYWHAMKDAARSLRRRPGLTTTCIVALGLGIGANTAVFSVVDAVLLRPLPYRNAGQLVSIDADFRRLNIAGAGMSVAEYEDLRDRAGVFDAMSFVWPMDGNLTGVSRPVRTEAMAVDVNYFELLGAHAALGRTFVRADARPGVSEAIVLSDGCWRRLFGADPNVVGRKIFLDYDTFVVVGVMPAGFRHPGATLQNEVEFWITGGFGGPPWGSRERRTARNLPHAIGRLKAGLTLEAARARLDAFTATLRQDHPDAYPNETAWTPRINSLQKELAGRNNEVLLGLMLGAVGLVLLACAVSVANLLLARSVARQQEYAVRAALGAGRRDLLRQLACEGLLLAGAGAACGLAAAAVVMPVLLDLAPVNLPQVNRPGVNLTLLGFTLAVAAVAAVLANSAPARQVWKLDLTEELKTRSSSGRAGRHRIQAVLVACQVALSLMLMIGCGLLLKSFWKLMQVDPGFQAKNVVVASIWLPPPTDPKADRKYLDPERRKAFVRELLRRAGGLPGVEAAAVGGGDSIPLAGWNRVSFAVESDSGEARRPTAGLTSVSPDFFKTLRVPLLEGRLFTETDDGGERVCIVDETLSRQFFHGQSPLGRRIVEGPARTPRSWTIVGVVGNIKTDTFDTPNTPHFYVPVYQRSALAVTVFLRSTAAPERLTDALRHTVEALDGDLPVFGVRTMEKIVERSNAQRRFALEAIGIFAALALALALMGIYSVTSFSVSERRREIGVRVAVGATPERVFGLVLGRVAKMACAGAAIGLAGALWLTRFLRSLLFEATATDPLTFGLVTVALLVVAMSAGWLPARRATKIDPASALRAE